MKKYWKIVLISLIIILLIVAGIILFRKKDKKEASSITSIVPTVVVNEDGVPKFIDGSYIEETVKDEDDIFKVLDNLKAEYGFKSAEDEFEIVNKSESEGMTYYRLQQKYKGLVVYNYQLVVSVDKENNVSSISGQYYPNIDVSTYSGLSKSEAQDKLEAMYEEGTYEILESDKYIYISEEGPVTSYVFSVIENTGFYDIIVRAKDAEIIKVYQKNTSANYSYTGKGIDGNEYTINLSEDNTVYSFYDEERNIKIIDAYDVPADGGSAENIKWLNSLYLTIHQLYDQDPIKTSMNEDGTLTYMDLKGTVLLDYSDRLPTAVTSMNNIAIVYDYYKSLGRLSFDGAGAEIRINIGVISDLVALGDNEFYNSFWNGTAFYYGMHNDVSLVYSLDVVAHEFTHAVTDYSANLVYEGVSGALNESYSDIMGSLIEGKNFEINESIETWRSMADPNIFEDPKVNGGKYYFPDDTEYYNDEWIENMLERKEAAGSPLSNWLDWDNGGVHTNSGVANHAAYLMYTNGAFDSKFQMAKVWYNSLLSLSPNSDFEDCALAVIKAGENLGLSEDKVQIIKDAFYETKMLERTYSLSGVVTDEETGDVLKDVSVTIYLNDNETLYFETLTDEHGKYVFENLKATDYSIYFEKSKYETNSMELTLTGDIDNFNAEITPIPEAEYDGYEVVFVMDISKSMDENDPEDIRKQIIANIVSSMESDGSAALVTFAKYANTVNEGLSDKEIDKRIILTDVFNIANDSGTTENSGTNGKAGLSKAISLLDEDTEKRKYIVFLTDGEDTIEDERTYDELTTKANKIGIRIITVGLGDVDTTQLNQIASKTNGKFYYANSSSDLHEFDKKIFDELK